MFQYRCNLCDVQIKVNISISSNIYHFMAKPLKVFSFVFKKCITLAGEMFYSVNCWLHKQENLSSDPCPHKNASVAEMGGSVRLTGVATSQMSELQVWESPCPKE